MRGQLLVCHGKSDVVFVIYHMSYVILCICFVSCLCIINSPIGTFSNVHQASSIDACQACPVGTYAAVNGSAVCTSCDEGTFQSEQGKSNCTTCDAGTASKARGATSGTVCLGCPAGTASVEGSKKCIPCQAGYFAGPWSSICLACPAGFFSLGGASICSTW